MNVSGHRHLVLEAIRLSSRPLDDDQLAARTGIAPRQTVNQICRALERAGLIRRVQGPDLKLVNEIASWDGAGAGDPAVVRAPAHTPPAGSSGEQRAAERVMLDLMGDQLGVTLEPATITVPSGARVEVDGADAVRTRGPLMGGPGAAGFRHHVAVVDLPGEVRQSIEEAQRRQYR